MTAVSVAVVFICIWWLVLFMTLPFGVRRVEMPEEGQDQGAPARPMLWRKAAATTAIAVVVTAALYGAVEYKLLTLSDLDFLQPGR